MALNDLNSQNIARDIAQDIARDITQDEAGEAVERGERMRGGGLWPCTGWRSGSRTRLRGTQYFWFFCEWSHGYLFALRFCWTVPWEETPRRLSFID